MVIPTDHSTQAIRLPALLFTTQRKMDDYDAADMRYGDISQQRLQQHYKLSDISLLVNPFTYPDRTASARVLFNEFRFLSGTFSFFGDYKSVIGKMITHMQVADGAKFTDKLLDDALEQHSSMESSLNKIRETIVKYTDWKNSFFPKRELSHFNINIRDSRLPKFDNWLDHINGLTISVHDTWATHITLESLEINGDKYKARIHYRIQDHFGLDDSDVTHWLYNQMRIFRIWFILQRWDGYAYKPFITEMNATVTIEGSRYESN